MESELRHWGAGQVFALGDRVPRIARDVFLASGSVVIGDVAPGRIGARSNIQDGSVIHADPGFPTIVGEDVLIGHRAIVHGASVRDRGFVGMGATLLNGATIESDGMLAAGAMLTGGKTVGAGELWAGTPAKLLRRLSEAQIAELRQGAARYVENARRYLRDLTPV